MGTKLKGADHAGTEATTSEPASVPTSVPTSASTLVPASASETNGIALAGRLVGLDFVAAERTSEQRVRGQRGHVPAMRHTQTRDGPRARIVGRRSRGA